MKKENRKLFIFVFGIFIFSTIALHGLVGIYEGVAAGFLEMKMFYCITHLIFGTAFTGMGVIGLGYMLEYWREKR